MQAQEEGFRFTFGCFENYETDNGTNSTAFRRLSANCNGFPGGMRFSSSAILPNETELSIVITVTVSNEEDRDDRYIAVTQNCLPLSLESVI